MKTFLNCNNNIDAWELYDKYNKLNITNNICHCLAIKTCNNLKDFNKGKQIHLNIINKLNTKQISIQILNVLIDFYGDFGYINEAKQIFNSINENQKDSVSLNTIMNVLIKSNNELDALDLYNKYKYLNNNTSNMLAIKGCININDFVGGNKIINEMKNNINGLELQSILIDFYGHFGEINKALNIFNNCKPNNIIVNTMMKALINDENSIKTLELYNKYESISDNISHLTAIKACIYCNNYEKGIGFNFRLSFKYRIT